jgi:DNA (cytosine-5)-methyltransferase 1
MFYPKLSFYAKRKGGTMDLIKKQLTFFDMFSGIGGFKIALEKAEFKCVGYCDNDKYATKLYREFFNTEEEMYFDDATTIRTDELPDFDILCAGFPCQAFSIAGKRRGFNESRGTMFFEVARILRDKKPKYFILENVKGLLNHERGGTFATIVKILSDLGYSTQWQVLNSKFFGIPQNRERVLLVGCLTGECSGKIFPISSNDAKNISNLNTIAITKGKSQGNRVYSVDGISSCLTSNGGGQGGKTGLYFINKPRFNTYKASDIVQTLKVAGDTPLMRVRNGTKKGYDEASIGDGISLGYPTSTTRRGRVGKQVSQTLDTHCQMGTIDKFRIRRLTPLECFRLQGFPDEMIKKAYALKISDAQLYKMAGNAVTVNTVYAVAKRIAEVENA